MNNKINCLKINLFKYNIIDSHLMDVFLFNTAEIRTLKVIPFALNKIKFNLTFVKRYRP